MTTVGDERQLEEAAQAAVQSQVATDVRRLLREQPKQQRPEPHEHDSAVACSCLLALPGRGAQVQQTRTRTGYVLFIKDRTTEQICAIHSEVFDHNGQNRHTTNRQTHPPNRDRNTWQTLFHPLAVPNLMTILGGRRTKTVISSVFLLVPLSTPYWYWLKLKKKLLPVARQEGARHALVALPN